MAAPSPFRPMPSDRVNMPSIGPGMNKLPPDTPKVPGKKQSPKEKKEAEQKKQDFLARVRKRFNRCVSVESENRKAAIDDLKFKSGEGQWPADVVSQRNFDRRPTLTINKLPTFVNQVVNDQRMNRPAINISPVGDKSDPEVAKMYRGLIRFIERNSEAELAYDTAFDNAVSNGFGYWRVTLDYENPESFDQDISIERIRNPFTVYLDPAHTDPTGADAKFGFVTENMPRKEFEEEYPHADPMPWTDGGFGEDYRNWIGSEEVRIAEYFEIKNEKRTLVELINGHVGWKDELAEGHQQILEERDSDWPTLWWYKLTATDILDKREWPGRWIPIIKVIGNEIDIEGKVRLSGLIRAAKQPQMLYNYNRTLAVELSSLQPKAPFIVAEGQIEGYEQVWKTANVKNNPYLPYRPVDLNGRPVPPPQRQPFQGPPAAVLAEVSAAEQDMIGTTGIRFSATLSERMYDESGRALKELRERGELGSFHYIDNLARSLRHCGEILVDLIPKVYERKRIVTILRDDDKEEQVQLDPAAPKPVSRGKNPITGKVMKIFDPNYGKYGVTVTIGPSYATKRIEASESMMDFLRAVAPIAPNIAAGVVDLVAKNQDWPDAEAFTARLVKMLPPNLLTPDMDDVPPQIGAMLQNLQQQVQGLNNEKQQLMQALTEQRSDRAQRQSKIDNDTETKLLSILAAFEAKMAAIQQKSEDATIDRVMAPMAELAAGVAELREQLRGNSDTIDVGIAAE